jgi:hypothetical protein
MMLIINQVSVLMGGYLLDKCSYALFCLKKMGLFFCFFLWVHPVESRNVFSELPKTFSWEERNALKGFFYELFAANELGYTLFGDKPMSLCFPSTSAVSFSTKDRIFKIYKRGPCPVFSMLPAWEKVKRLANLGNYIFISHETNGFPESVFLINKHQFFCILNKNIDVLRKTYGYKVTPESFLADLINKKIQLEHLLQQHLLLGILLGYGRHNAELFQRREDLFVGKKQVPFLSSQRPSSRFSSVEKELETLDQKLLPVYRKNIQLLLVKPVSFVADLQHPETRQLAGHYGLLHKELTALFLSEDWFSSILEKMGS